MLSFIKIATLWIDSESSSKLQTQQRYSKVFPYGKVAHLSNKINLSSRQDLNEEFRRKVIKQIKIRVEVLQSKIKSKMDMFYVMRHMCKKTYAWANLDGYSFKSIITDWFSSWEIFWNRQKD